MEDVVRKISDIFFENITEYKHHPRYKRLLRYGNKLKNMCGLELRIMVSVGLLSYYTTGTMNMFIKQDIEQKYDIDLSQDVFDDIERLLNKLCIIYLSE